MGRSSYEGEYSAQVAPLDSTQVWHYEGDRAEEALAWVADRVASLRRPRLAQFAIERTPARGWPEKLIICRWSADD